MPMSRSHVNRRAQRHAEFLALIRGETPGLEAALSRSALWLASGAYRTGVQIRNRLIDWDLTDVHRLPVPVISVGNLTTGGTGKTPLVEWVARDLTRRGHRPAILARGYGPMLRNRLRDLDPSEPATLNDEGVVLRSELAQVPVLLGPDRIVSAQAALARASQAPDSFILDDGFQHRRIHRDLDIVLLDALCPFGLGHLLPRGLLREPVRNLRRAHLIVISHADLAAPAAVAAIEATVREHSPLVPILTASHRILDFRTSSGPFPPERLARATILAFCGVGNPLSFRQALERLHLNLADFVEFPDHHAYSASDIAAIERAATRLRASLVLTTQKDAVKLLEWPSVELPLVYTRVGLRFLSGEKELVERMEGLYPRFPFP